MQVQFSPIGFNQGANVRLALLRKTPDRDPIKTIYLAGQAICLSSFRDHNAPSICDWIWVIIGAPDQKGCEPMYQCILIISHGFAVCPWFRLGGDNQYIGPRGTSA